MTGDEGEPAVRTEGLAKHYGDVTALDDLSLTVPRGELFGFLGPNGAGKSTTINILTGQLVPDEGTAEVVGIDPVAEPVRAREAVGILPENGRPPSFLTVREYFEFVAATRDLDDGTVQPRVDAWADRLEFEHKLDTLCTDLSQGERQKVLITQAFLHEPDVVFIDEPLTNLDPIMQERVKRFFREYRADGNTLFLSTHFIGTAEEVCTQVGIINRGRLLAEIDPRELGAEESLLDRFFAAVDADSKEGAVIGEGLATDAADPAAMAEEEAVEAETDGGEASDARRGSSGRRSDDGETGLGGTEDR
ncbi:ABC transporter ATP-binding protein [Haloglomus halophilum]|uniref:ABC transporter ATP-binding protein n=1 Tax=Haloglomus halophilum TaxID=2962672 RepID=UPI003313CC95